MNLLCFSLLYFALSVSAYKNPYKSDTHECTRECKKNSPPMKCEYNFKLEYYHTLSMACFDCPFNMTDCFRPDCVSLDGVNKPLILANRQFPGPSIQVCEGDRVIVNVDNFIVGQTTALHWHGLHMRGTPFMDGVPMVSQCPQLSGNSFRYEFNANPRGTHFWHSHQSHQRPDGLFGPIAVRQPKTEDPHGDLYDYDLPEHVFTITDVLDIMSVTQFAWMTNSDGKNLPGSILINGKGWHKEIEKEGKTYKTPLHEFSVQKGKKYRFRVVSNGIFNCPLSLSIDGHKITAIASDGAPFQPLEVDSVVLYSGERFDFIVDANQESDVYWVKVQGLRDCARTKARGLAVLRYDGVDTEYPSGGSSWEDAGREGLTLNAFNQNVGTEGTIAISETVALEKDDDEILKEEPDHKFYLAMDINLVNNLNYYHPKYYPFSEVNKEDLTFSPQINHISLKLPTAPVLNQLEDNDPSMFCNHTTKTDCENTYCECVYVLEVKLGSVVELVLIDEGKLPNTSHPMHMHGYSFRVLAMEKLGDETTLEEVKALDDAGKIKRNLKDAPIKDSVNVFDGGYTVVRFKADNPGFWMFHCHLEWHLDVGMGLVFKVGEKEDFGKPPPHFYTCGNWPPTQTK